MNRLIALDTETTGLKPEQGHRIIEIGLVEIIGNTTGNAFSMQINPQRDIDPGAQAVHGISIEQLRDKPTFGDIAEAFLGLIEDTTLIIHNAPFDVGFLDAELTRLGPQWGRISDYCSIICTREIARKKLPCREIWHLNDLCDRYGIDRSQRQTHSALLDANLLAEVWRRLSADAKVWGASLRASQPKAT
ncbi:MAG: DNA polymerase III subunit epsilon [Magnetovibrio sp.]|nr:DNA polymerase III subunit epsilon [Magnetovibrio sp.]